MTPKQAAIAYWGNDNPPQELIAAMAEAQRPLLEALEEVLRRIDDSDEWLMASYMNSDGISAAIAATKGE